jgi:hypothetical protein
MMVALIGLPPSDATAADRDVLTCDELLSADPGAVEVVDNAAFLPMADPGPPLHAFEGTLTVPRTAMLLGSSSFSSYRYFPGFSVDFFTTGDHLVPVERGIIRNPDNWSLILSPGRVWSEGDDCGMTRASFAFTLGSPPDRQYTGGEAHNGVATMVFDDDRVSALRVQVSQETAPDGDIFDMWAQLPVTYEPGSVEGVDELRAAFADELEDRFEVRSWADLEDRYDMATLDRLTEGLPPESVSAAGLVVDGTLFVQPNRTRHGTYPYPEYMQLAAMSISKSIGAGIGMLWLAEEYGDGVFDLRVGDYLDINAAHDGWNGVTFGDVLDMATGVGDNAPEEQPFDPYANESGPNYRDFYLAATTDDKLEAAFGSIDYAWGPGELLRYTSAQTFVLAAAMDAFLKTQEGPGASLWASLQEKVFAPIGIHHMTMMLVDDGHGGGIPLMSSGLRLTVDDLANVATLLQDGGSHDGLQILNASRLRDALYRTGEVTGLPSGKTFADGDQGYHASFWSLPYRSEQGGYFQVPFMSGAGGNTVFLAPNGVTTFVFTDHGQDTYSLNSPAVAEVIRPYPESDLTSVVLIPRTGPPPALVVAIVVAALAVLVLVSMGVLRFARRGGEARDSRASGRRRPLDR